MFKGGRDIVLSGMCGHKNKKCFQQHKSESTSMFHVNWEEFRELKNYKHTFCEPSLCDNIRIYSLARSMLGFRQDSGQEQHFWNEGTPSGMKGVRLPQNISLSLLGGAEAKSGEVSKAIISSQFQDGL